MYSPLGDDIIFSGANSMFTLATGDRRCFNATIVDDDDTEDTERVLSLGLIKDFVLSVWEERKARLYGEHANVHQSHSQNDSGDLRGVTGGDGELGCLCGKAGTGHLCDGSAHSSGCVVNGSNAMAAF